MITARLVLIIAAAAAAVVAVALAYGARRWEAGTRELRARLEAARVSPTPRRVDFREIEGLPAPVEHYFRLVLTDGQPIVTGVRVRHRGTFNMSETAEQWKPFTSDQRVIARRPGFDWDGRIAMMPGLSVRVHDAYVAGEGILHAAVLGLIPVASLGGTREMAEGELMRFLAEATWYPTALLPGPGVRWEASDAHSARVTLVDEAVAVTMLFSFNHEGAIDTVQADARGRAVGGRVVPTPWQGRCWNYERSEGMLVPIDGEVAWLLPEGAKPYWRGHVSGIEYEFAQ